LTKHVIINLNLYVQIFKLSNLTGTKLTVTYYSCECKCNFYFQAEDTHSDEQNDSAQYSGSGKVSPLFQKERQLGFT
jgi:hypothetical protein